MAKLWNKYFNKLEMRFCPNDGSMLMPVKKGNAMVLRCPKCGYEIAVDDSVKREYRGRTNVGEEKKRGVISAVEMHESMDQEQLEELRKQLLENLQESESD